MYHVNNRSSEKKKMLSAFHFKPHENTRIKYLFVFYLIYRSDTFRFRIISDGIENFLATLSRE